MKISLYQPLFIHQLGQRDNQEDSLLPDENQASPQTRLFLVCDGMGGHSNGEVASQNVCRAFDEYFAQYADYGQIVDDAVLRGALEHAYGYLDAKDDGAYKKMGTTLTLVCFHKGGVTMAHAGDSRIYHVRPGEARPLYRSRDHSLVFDMYQAGEITYEEMKTDRRKNIITRALMPGEENRVELAVCHTTDVLPGDYFYLCSDGMLEEMEDDELVGILSAEIPDEAKIDILLQKTENNKDNHTAYLIRVSEVSAEAGDKSLLHDENTSRVNAMNLVPVHDEENSELTVSEGTVEGIPAQEPVPPVPEQMPRQPYAQQMAPQMPSQMPNPQMMNMQAVPKKSNALMWLLIVCLAVVACVGGYFLVKNFRKGGRENTAPVQQTTTPQSNQSDLQIPQSVPSATESEPAASPSQQPSTVSSDRTSSHTAPSRPAATTTSSTNRPAAATTSRPTTSNQTANRPQATTNRPQTTTSSSSGNRNTPPANTQSSTPSSQSAPATHQTPPSSPANNSSTPANGGHSSSSGRSNSGIGTSAGSGSVEK